MKTITVGMIGLDTSHATAFTKLLNDPSAPHHVPGAKVVAAFPGGSPDFELSRSRVDGFTKQLREEFGVAILSSPAAVAEQADLVFIESVDGRVHRRQFEETASFGKPTFVDKPFALTVADAEAMLKLAGKHGLPLMSSSALRYADNFRKALEPNAELGPIIGVDTFGPMNIEPTQPGLFWYGIHCAEMIVAALGPGCQRVQATAAENYDLITALWTGGRSVLFRGLRKAHWRFGVTLHREKGAQMIDIQANERPYYAGLIEAILRSLPQGRSDVPAAEMLEIVRFIEAANRSRETGKPVEL